jgi:hypothetical protein
MKTKDLIKQLQEQDPSGDLEVVVGNLPIVFAYKQPGYYDGLLQILIKDEQGYHSGYKFTPRGMKIQIHTTDLDGQLLDDPELPVDISEVSDHSIQRYKDLIEKTRQEMRDIKTEVAEHVKTIK